MNKLITNFETLVKREYGNIAGIVVRKDDEIVYESYFSGYSSDDTIHIMSVTKSVISILIGIAIDNGYIQSIDQKVLDFFPNYVLKRGEKTIRNVTLKNMLTMTAPYKYKSEPYTKVYASSDWTRAALDLLGGRAGITGEFKYSTVGTQILSGVLEKATGVSVLDFASEYLFVPIGIRPPINTTVHNKDEHFAFLKNKHVCGWIVDPSGTNTAGWGLCLTPRDMAKIGQLYLNDGIYCGRRVVASKWIDESTKEHSHWNSLSYGYLWWVITNSGKSCYAAVGDGGNVIFVDPGKDMVIAIASRFSPGHTVRIIDLITQHIIPIFALN